MDEKIEKIISKTVLEAIDKYKSRTNIQDAVFDLATGVATIINHMDLPKVEKLSILSRVFQSSVQAARYVMQDGEFNYE
jgi:hypothetical protein